MWNTFYYEKFVPYVLEEESFIIVLLVAYLFA